MKRTALPKLLSCPLLIVAVLTSGMNVYANEADYAKNIGKTPPMGWNSWNKFHAGISAEIIRGIADGAAKYKLNEAGYKYLVIDDAWQARRLGPNGKLVANPTKFRDGIAPLVKYVRQRGFELGIYACPNRVTCAGFPGSLGREQLHAKQFADWGCKFLKYDFCPTRSKEIGLPYDEVVRRYRVMSKALHAVDPHIVYAICEKGHAGRINRRTRRHAGITTPVTDEQRRKAFAWCPEVGGVMWRTTGDISAKWDRIVSIVDEQEGLAELSGPGAFNDPDMLEVGNGNLTASENRAHFSLWCMLSAPLILGNDLRKIPREMLEIITNKEVIALDQDLMCKAAEKVVDQGDIECFLKPLADGDFAVCVLNRSRQAKEVIIDWSKLGLSRDTYAVRDLWAHKDLGSIKNRLTRTVGSHDVFVARLTADSKD